MAHWKTNFPSKFLQAADLDTPLLATIREQALDNVGSGDRIERKPVLHFKEDGIKAVVMNQTRSEAVEAIAGTGDPDRWPGTRVKLYRGSTRFQGKTVACIAIGAPDPRPRRQRPADEVYDSAAPAAGSADPEVGF